MTKLLTTLAMLYLLSYAGWTPAEEAAAPVPNKGDMAWMLTSTALVLLMSVPALALFYGGWSGPRICCRC